jgi:hypothetical protein
MSRKKLRKALKDPNTVHQVRPARRPRGRVDWQRRQPATGSAGYQPRARRTSEAEEAAEEAQALDYGRLGRGARPRQAALSRAQTTERAARRPPTCFLPSTVA